MGVYLALVAAALLACAARAQRDARYDTRYDYLDVDAILDSRRLVRNYVECLINKKPCSPEGKALKRILPEALRTKCARCTERQRQSAVKIIKRLKSDYQDEWASLAGRWDPNGDFTAYFEHVVTKEENNGVANDGLIPQATGVPVIKVSAPTNLGPLRPVVLTRLDEKEDAARTRPTSAATISPSSVTSPSTTTQEYVRVESNENTNVADSRPIVSIVSYPVAQRPTSTTSSPVRVGRNENTNKAESPSIVSIVSNPPAQRPPSTTPPAVRVGSNENTNKAESPSIVSIVSNPPAQRPPSTTSPAVRVGSNENMNKPDSPPLESIASNPVAQRPSRTTPPPVRIPEIRPQEEQPLDGSVQDSSPTKVTFRPVYFPVNEYPDGISSSDNVMANPLVSGTMGIIGHFSNKIIRTTELVTDILKNTVRTIANVG